MRQFASGWKQNYYGKGDVIAYRLNRDGKTAAGASPVFGANITILVYGDAFWPTYTTGDNTGLIATDSMKNFVQREMLNYEGSDLEDCCRFLGAKFLDLYPQVEGVQMSAVEIPYAALPHSDVAFAPAGSGVRHRASGTESRGSCGDCFRHPGLQTAAAGRQRVSRVSCAINTPRCPTSPTGRCTCGWIWNGCTRSRRRASAPAPLRRQCGASCAKSFRASNPASIQQVIYQIGTKMLAEIPSVAEVHLEGNNRTWDTIVERGEELGVYTEARPPFGCLGLRLKR